MTDHKLGRSIEDLLEENDVRFNEFEKIEEINLDRIMPNPNQPRSLFDTESIKELAQSIVEHGVIQPIIVKEGPSGYILVAGERRVRASKIAGKLTVPAIVRDYNSKYLSELAILENLQREDLTPIEEAIAFKSILMNSNITHEELGKRVGKSRTYITNIIGLLKLPAVVMEDVNSKRLTMGHARALSKISDIDVIMSIRDEIISLKLSVRDVESIIRERYSKKTNKISADLIIKAEKQIESIVKDDIKYKLNKNQLVLKFKSEEELNKIIEFLKRG
jgi:ParB family chromosome partitioning protein